MPSSFKTILVWILAVSLQLALLGCVVGCGEQAIKSSGEKVFVSQAELHSAESPDECSLNFPEAVSAPRLEILQDHVQLESDLFDRLHNSGRSILTSKVWEASIGPPFKRHLPALRI
jgi:hypothetical protein